MTDRLARVVAFLLMNTRPRFHPAVWGLSLFLLLSTLMYASFTVVFWLLELAGVTRGQPRWEALLVIGGVWLAGELVRGHVKAWLGKGPEEWSYVAIGVAGAVAGLLFVGYIALGGGDGSLTDGLISMTISAALWLAIGALWHWDEKGKQRKAAESGGSAGG